MKKINLLLTTALATTSCAISDPYAGPGSWRPNGSNDKNLRAMVADPQDLVTGVVDHRADGQVVAAAVARYRAGKVKELPDASASKISPISINNGGSSAPATDSN